MKISAPSLYFPSEAHHKIALLRYGNSRSGRFMALYFGNSFVYASKINSSLHKLKADPKTSNSSSLNLGANRLETPHSRRILRNIHVCAIVVPRNDEIVLRNNGGLDLIK